MTSSFKAFTPGEFFVSGPAEPVKSPHLQKGNRPSYAQIKQTFVKNEKRLDRFSISELVTNQFSIEEEEQRRFDLKVNQTVTEKIDQIKKTAYEDGHKLGIDAGTKEAYDEEKIKLAEKIENLSVASGVLVKAKTHLGQHYQKTLTEMAFQIAQIIMKREISERPESVASTIADILEHLEKEDHVTIRVASRAFDVLGLLDTAIKEANRDGKINFDLDVGLAAGDCVVAGHGGEISSVISEKIKKLEEIVLTKLSKEARESGT